MMNIFKWRLVLCCLAAAWLAPAAVYADPSTIYDYSDSSQNLDGSSTYYGGGYTQYINGNDTPVTPAYTSDVLGAEHQYAVDTLTVTRGNNSFIATLTGPYFAAANNVPEFIGDLFLTTHWDPSTTGGLHYDDNTAATSATTWNYVLSIVDDQGKPIEIKPGGGSTTGKIVLYAVNSDAEIVLTNDEKVTQQNGSIYRADQELYYIPVDDQDPLATGEWTLEDGVFTFTLNDFLDGNTLASLGLDGALGLHWTMSCGNDVIEGKIPSSVPEPAAMILFGFGLSGVAAYSRRRKAS